MYNKTILLIEDSPDDVILTVRTLNKSHIKYNIVTVGDGIEALDYLFGTGKYAERGPAELPALVLLDLKLPRLSGLDVLKRLRADERTKSVPVVILTSSGQEKDLIASHELWANGYIRKPIELSLFAEAVQELGLYWLLTDEAHPEKQKVTHL